MTSTLDRFKWFVLGAVTVGIPACASVSFPDEFLYSPDLVNGVCAEYKLADAVNITYAKSQNLPLVAGGPCDRMRGWSRTGFKRVQNWARDTIKGMK